MTRLQFSIADSEEEVIRCSSSSESDKPSANGEEYYKSYPMSANTHLSANKNTKSVPILTKICG